MPISPDEYDMSARLKNVLGVYYRSIPNSPVEDLMKDIFLCIPNAGETLWIEFRDLLVSMMLDQAEQSKIDKDLSKNT